MVALVVVALMTAPAFAHPGRTDGSGGHYDRSTGDYHYHHGYGAHDHVDGVCPYDYDDKTGENSGSSSSSSSGSLKKNYDQAGLTSIYQTLQKGDRGNAVADLQKRLNTLGYSVGAADGVFGDRTVAAVKRFQKDNGINATGNVSYVTLAALFPELAPSVTARPTTKPIVGSAVTTKPATESVVSVRQPSAPAKRIAKALDGIGIGFALLITIGWMPLLLLWGLIIELVDRVKNVRSRKR